jgi:hypothetical protein
MYLLYIYCFYKYIHINQHVKILQTITIKEFFNIKLIIYI